MSTSSAEQTISGTVDRRCGTCGEGVVVDVRLLPWARQETWICPGCGVAGRRVLGVGRRRRRR